MASLTSKPQNLRTKCLISGNVTANGALYATPLDRQAAEEAYAAAVKAMEADGFEASETPNLYVKAGKYLTVEAYRHGRRV